MHIVRQEFIADRDAGLAFAQARGFGLVIAVDGGRPITSHLPFHLNAARGVVGLHVAFDNPLAALADGREFVLAVAGDDAYISNDWYATPDQVSTWLYESVHLAGPAWRQPVESNRTHGEQLLATCEARLPKAPWQLDTMAPAKRAGMLARIHSIEIVIASVQFQRKLNQFKPDVDHVAVVQALRRHGDAAGQRIADRMQQLRPHLDHDEPIR